MKDPQLQAFLEQDLLPRNEILGFRCNRKLATFIKGYAALNRKDPSAVLRFAVQRWAESEGYNPTGL